MSFNASAARAATGHSIVEYSWNFGDGGTGSGLTPSHTFGTAGTYSVVLVVKDDLGQTGTASKTVPVTSNSPSPPPTADFVFSPTNPIVAQSVSFNAALSKAATGRTISSYAWNFGDGGAAGTGVNPSRTFSNTGTFSVVLTVTDDIGQSATVAKTVTVTATPSDPPTASFVFSPGSPQVNQAVLFDATQSTVAAGHTLSYAWNFGDSLTGTGVTPSHTYTAAGTYSVVLKVTDTTTLQTATTTRTVTVSSIELHAANGGLRVLTGGATGEPVRAVRRDRVDGGSGPHPELCLEFRRQRNRHGRHAESHVYECRHLQRRVEGDRHHDRADGHVDQDRSGQLNRLDATTNSLVRVLAAVAGDRAIGVVQRDAVHRRGRPFDRELRLELRRWRHSDRCHDHAPVRQRGNVQRRVGGH